ncbi:MAG: N-acetylneuraminate synthase family protein [Burkholderiales bacterium]
MRIGRFDSAARPILIAEIGNNHEGDAGHARELVAAALEAGADAVKVQVIDPPRLVNIAQAERIAQLGRFVLPLQVFVELAEQTRAGGAAFMASAFDVDSLAHIAPHCDALKVASGDLTFDALLVAAASHGPPVVLSTGMARMAEVARAVDVFAGATVTHPLEERLALLHCVSLYPTGPGQANLGAIGALAAAFGLPTGYSDHTLGIEAALVALGLGARIIEKHFTIDKARSAFRDHALSADPAEFARLAGVVRGYRELLGSGRKDEKIADAASAAAVRRSAVAARDLAAGTVLAAADLDYVRPGDGISPAHTATITGRHLRRALPRHAVIRMDDLG